MNRKVIGFDTFEGFRSLSAKDDAKLKPSDFSNTDGELLQSMGEISDLNRPLGHIPKLTLVKGDATKTIPTYVKQHPELIIALLYIDFDIYQPTKTAIKHLLPLVPKGGIVAFDELNCAKWAGETKAVKEMLNLQDLRLQKFEYEPWMSYYVVE